jgi:hypothetical protein
MSRVGSVASRWACVSGGLFGMVLVERVERFDPGQDTYVYCLLGKPFSANRLWAD